MFDRYTKKRGFTLVELIVAVAIMAVLVGLVLANLKQGAKSDILRVAADQVLSVSRKAQSLALVGSEQNLPPAALNNSGAFGIHFDLTRQTEYRLFLDFQDSAGELVPDGKYQPGEELPNSAYYLPRGIVFDSLEPIEANVLDITFSPPKPITYFNGLTDEPSAEIGLEQADSGQRRYIRINRISGQISVLEQL